MSGHQTYPRSQGLAQSAVQLTGISRLPGNKYCSQGLDQSKTGFGFSNLTCGAGGIFLIISQSKILQKDIGKRRLK
jgi:hypothetical protein